MRKWLPLIAVCLGTFMLLVDVTIVTVALPQMARSLDSTFADLQWVMDVYALVLAALLLAAGSLGDRAGHRRLYVAGLVVFAGASLACGLATSPGMLIAFRAVQGVGGAAMLATTVALISHLYSGRDLGTAFGVWGAVSGAAAATGPIMGGLLTQHLDWRWIFFVNLPISVLAVAMTLRYVGESRVVRRGGLNSDGIDLAGLVTFTAAAGLATYALIKGNDYGWGSPRTIGVFAGAGVALAAWIGAELKGKAPMLDLSLFRRGTFTGVMIGALMLSGAAFSYFAYESLWLQSVRGMGPVTAGLCFLPMSGAAFVTAGLGGRLLEDRVSPRLMIGGGLLLIAAGSTAQTAVGAGSSWTVLVPGLAVSGVGVGLATPTLASTAIAAVGYQRAGMASGAVNTARQLGNALGIAVLGVVFHAGLASSVRDAGVPRPAAVADALAAGQSRGVLAAGTPAQRPALDHMAHAAFASGLQSAFLAAAVMGAVGGVAVLALVRRPGGGHAGPEAGQGTRPGAAPVAVPVEA